MKLLLLLMLALSITAPFAIAAPAEDPNKLAPPVEGPELPNPSGEPKKLPAPAENAKKPGKPPEFFQARRKALAARKAAQRERARQFKAARAAAEQKAYQDWHERYLADTPVREEYYRALSNAYLAEAAYARERTYFAYWAPPVFVPIIPVYPPIYEEPFYGTTLYWGW